RPGGLRWVAHGGGRPLARAGAPGGGGQYRGAGGRPLNPARHSCLFQSAARSVGRGPGGIGVVRPEQIEPAFAERLRAFDTPRVGALAERGEPVRVELAVAEVRTGMAAVATTLADEDLQAALGSLGIAPGPDGLAPLERVAKLVEGRHWALERLFEGGERLGDIHQHALVVRCRGRGPESLAVTAGELLVVAHELGDVARARSQLANVEDGTDALRPQAVRAPVPAEPVPLPDVHQGGRVAIHLRRRGAARPVVGPVALGD